MKKMNAMKLKLTTDTIRVLDAKELGQAAGGMMPATRASGCTDCAPTREPSCDATTLQTDNC